MEAQTAYMQLAAGLEAVLTGVSSSMGHSTSYVEDSAGIRFEFVVLCSHGIKKEFEAPYYYPNETEAVQDYVRNLSQFLSPIGDKTVYWRCFPQLESTVDGYFVYSRLVVAPAGCADPILKDCPQPPTLIEYLQPGWRTFKKGPNSDNKTGFRATGHRILLVPEPIERKTASGILLAEKTVYAEEQRAVICTVLEIGPDAWSDKSTDYCEVGDRVLIGQYVGKFHESPVDGKTYRFVADLDIISPLPKKEV
jgi:co-chaperonin GroES (HSP10)